MIKNFILRTVWLTFALAGLFFVTGCGTNTPEYANIVIQLTLDGSTPYTVDNMTISVQKSGGSVLTGTTDTSGRAVIKVTETGTYNILQVAGVDSTSLAQDSDTGREFVKTNPVTNPYPNLLHAFSGVTAEVPELGSNYNVNVTVPLINKITVLTVAHATSDTNGAITISAGEAAFAGRMIVANVVFTSTGGPAEGALAFQSSSVYLNELVLYEASNALAISGGAFYGGPSFTGRSIGAINYLLAGPIYFEAPGTANGDWALGYNLSTANADLVTRAGLGGENVNINFPFFNGGAGANVLRARHTSGGYSPYAYSFDYRIFEYTEY